MTYKYNIQATLASSLVIAFVLGEGYHLAEGFKADLQLYFSSEYYTERDHLHFESKQPNFDAYRELFPNFPNYSGICGLGCWAIYNGYNYTDRDTRLFLGSYYNNVTLCTSFPLGNIKSLRYLGGSEPSNITLSLFEGASFNGKETLIEGRVLTGITSKTLSLVSTGGIGSEWSLFEGQQLDGNSYCFPAPFLNYYFYNLAASMNPEWNLATIGSVFKGCDIAEIQEYKRNNNM